MEYTNAGTDDLRRKSEQLLEIANDALECGDFERADELVDAAAAVDAEIEARGEA